MSARTLAICALVASAFAGCASTPSTSHHHHGPEAASSAPGPEHPEIGVIVAAPDRGFLGNEEVGDAFAGLARHRNAELVFVTDERTRDSLAVAIAAVQARGARQAVVLPLFVSSGERGFRTLGDVVAKGGWAIPLTLGQRFGESYLAVELLADRFRAIPERAGRRAVVLGHGARDEADRGVMAGELQALADRAAAGFGFEAVKVAVWLARGEGRDSGESALAQAMDGPRPAVVPFELGPKMDSMMSFGAEVRGDLGKAPVSASLTPDPLIALWMEREANRHAPLADADIGVVFLAHGADFHWNDRMRRAVDSVVARHKVEFAFCMADAPLVERAIRRLEARGARAAVVVRVFGLRSSFQGTVERMLGLDIEGGGSAAGGGHADHGHGHGHGHGGASDEPPARIRTALRLATVGGLEDSPLFAEALLDRALSLSKDPARETVVLVAHGAGPDAQNDHWRGLLGSLATQMRAGAGAKFRAIKFGTWREDWPDKREPEIAAIRAMVEEGSRDGGRVIVIPARTTSEGPEDELLQGLTYVLGSGFAPHRLFEAWVEGQIRDGVAILRGTAKPAPPPAGHDHHHH